MNTDIRGGSNANSDLFTLHTKDSDGDVVTYNDGLIRPPA